ncbi:MAG: 30S ribosomal protein S17 [Deltaproteobacteria bacterium]|nr:30S ribosomal protein S17 [Deltaproteobacteria bacterium]MCF8118951.1 30S ribosomal protein S17 [Deltaproteobacteria bacterium]
MTERGLRKGLVGTVVSDRMEKTVVVLVERLTKHAIYKKYIRKRSKYMAHDPQNKCVIGDKVRITESRPISKNKRWRVSELIEKSQIER